MIVFPRSEDIVMIRQHDHAYVSGELAKKWREKYFRGEERKSDVIFAIYEHDRGWIDLDEVPVMNDKTGIPYSFEDYPLPVKLKFYSQGIDEVEKANRYAALLCSMHYMSFFAGERHNPRCLRFVREESGRQRNIKQELGLNSPKQLEHLKFHHLMLKFCDHVSLYICLNEPGVKKEAEFIWFRHGFADSEQFFFAQNRKIQARWLDAETVAMSVFPFAEAVTVALAVKAVNRAEAKKRGIAAAYADAPWMERRVTFVPDTNPPEFSKI